MASQNADPWDGRLSEMISRLLRTVSNRRAFLSAGASLPFAPLAASSAIAAQHTGTHAGGMTTVGTVDHGRNGFDPHDLLTDWDTGTIETSADGQRVRTYDITAIDVEIEIAPGIFFPAWTYNGRVPGPARRAPARRPRPQRGGVWKS